MSESEGKLIKFSVLFNESISRCSRHLCVSVCVDVFL